MAFMFHFIYGMSSFPLTFTPSFFKMVKLHHQAVEYASYVDLCNNIDSGCQQGYSSFGKDPNLQSEDD